MLTGAFKLTFLGSLAGKNAHFRLRQQARALGITALQLRKLLAQRRIVAHARAAFAVLAALAQVADACKPRISTARRHGRRRSCVPCRWLNRCCVSNLKPRLTPAGHPPNFAEPGKRW